MDRLIKRFEYRPYDDLMICEARGIAYQRDMTKRRVAYDNEYAKKFEAYDVDISDAVTDARLSLIHRTAPQGLKYLDWGCGDGAFLGAARAFDLDALGYEIIPDSARRLIASGLFADKVGDFDAVCMWDTLEHIDNPGALLQQMRSDALLFVSLPIFKDLGAIRESKHYRPGEHLYYFTAQGFIDYAALYGFRLLEQSDHEVIAGRDSIGAFAFRKDLKTYRGYIDQYAEKHETKYYGSSATELHLGSIAEVVKRVNPKSILDYGCGRSDLLAHFWLDGKRRLARYDPAIRKYRALPRDHFDLVISCDVMEHIPMSHIDTVLEQIKTKSTRAVFTISMKLARAKLPDGENAHCTILNSWEWIKWMRSYFKKVETMPSAWDTELILYCADDK